MVRNRGFYPVPEDRVWDRFAEHRETVTKRYLEGKTIHEIAHEEAIPLAMVRTIVSRAALKQEAQAYRAELLEEVFKDRVPLLKEVTQLSLLTLRDFLQNLSLDEARKGILTIKDAKDLSSIAKEINEIARLELGQSTQNVEIVQRVERDVNVLIEDLKKTDPFKDYERTISAEPVQADDQGPPRSSPPDE